MPEQLRLRHGITPACAGRRAAKKTRRCRKKDHPRVCGEKTEIVRTFCQRVGITPACAGRSFETVGQCEWAEDHPRVCGEKRFFWDFFHTDKGSPPRVRGEATANRSATSAGRITPACAGRRRGGMHLWLAVVDHPRVCGEKMARHPHADKGGGSPPRVRGEDIFTDFKSAYLGITPACAGRREAIAPRHQGDEDHPRVCGEKGIFSARAEQRSGSPPRVRGEGIDAEFSVI